MTEKCEANAVVNQLTKQLDDFKIGTSSAGDHNNQVIGKIVDAIVKQNATNIVVLCGAGISVSANIPDFRTPGTGLYSNLKRFNLPEPTAVFDLAYFRRHPQPFYQLAKELYPTLFQPTLTHYFIRLLDEQKRLLRVFSQNIDSLEQLAGISADRVIQAHGSFDTAHCIDCKKEYDANKLREKILKGGDVPVCTSCKGYVKPDIVFFGENLPSRFFHHVRDLERADLVIVMGTSLSVYPFASLLEKVNPSVCKILINNELVGQNKQFHLFYRGNCDSAISAIIRKLNWTSELAKILDTEQEEQTLEIVEDTQSQYKMVLVVNDDLKMKKGKVAAQVGHAVSSLLQRMIISPGNNAAPEEIFAYYRWTQNDCETTIVKKASVSDLTTIIHKYTDRIAIVKDAGKTQVAANSLTVVGFLPCRTNEIPIEVAAFKLL